MKTKLLLIIIFASHSLWATHNRAGFITYRYISYLTCQVTITTFTKASSTQADRDTLNLDWGDGTIEKVLRSNGNGQGIVLPGYDIKLNKYESSIHTYSTPCDYIISVTDPNRISNIININGGASVNIQFYIEALIRIESGNSCNNSGALLLSHPVWFGNINDTLSFNPTIMDPDGDSLYFELIPPLQAQGFVVPNYQYPDEINPGINNSFSINPISGEVSWFTPQRVGIYNIAIRTKEFKNGVFYGYTIFDCQIIVEDDITDPPSFSLSWQADSNGNYSFVVNPDDTLQLDFTATADSLRAFGEVFQSSHPATFSQNGPVQSLNGSFLWVPDSSDSRLYPYITTFRALNQDQFLPLESDLTVLIYVTGGSHSSCIESPACNTSSGGGSEENSSVTISPNPFTSFCRISVYQSTSEGNFTLRLYDITGKYLYSLQSSSGEFIIEKGTLGEGLHFFKINDNASNKLASGKVVLRTN